MKTGDVTATLEDALAASGCDSATVVHKPRLLSDDGSSYISGDLAKWLGEQGMDHVRRAPKAERNSLDHAGNDRSLPGT